DVTRAALPTADRGELASIATAIPPLTGVPFAVGRDATSLGDVGLPHPGRIAPNAPNMANAVARAQNPRRVCPLQSVSFIADLRGRLACGSCATSVPVPSRNRNSSAVHLCGPRLSRGL